MTRVLYVQYTNPGGYPPLEHSSSILADGGAEVLVLGTTAPWMKRMAWPPRHGITVRIMPRRAGGLGQKIDYLRFLARVLRTIRSFRPDWIYVSDPYAAPAGLAARRITNARVLYHEHDEPFAPNPSRFTSVIGAARRRLARLAEQVVVPNAARGERLRQAADRRGPLHVVWNCVRAGEVRPNTAPAHGPLRVLYQGSIARERVPLTLIEVMRRIPEMHLVVIGYEPPGAAGHLEALRGAAARAGVADRLQILGEIARHEILEVTAGCHVGLSFRAAGSVDPNEVTMVGASNKAFEYLACGLALLVNDDPEWHRHFVSAGLARACDPMDPASLAEAVSWFIRHRSELPAIGRRGAARIRHDWNYDAQFAPVARLILTGARTAASVSEPTGHAAPTAKGDVSGRREASRVPGAE